MKNHLLQNLKILLLGILTLTFLVITIISAIPKAQADLIMQEPFVVSSSQILANSDQYSTQISGVIKNTTGKSIVLQDVLVKVSDGETETVQSVGGVTLPPRTTWSYLEKWESNGNFNRIISIHAVINGEEVAVSNADDSFVFKGGMVIGLLLCAGAALLLAHACKIRYYMMQEDQFKASQAQS